MPTWMKLIIVAMAITAMVAVLYYEKNNEDDNISVTENNSNSDDVTANVFNQYGFDYNEQNTVNNTAPKNNNKTNTNVTNNTSNTSSDNTADELELTGTNEEKVVALVKNEWGSDDSVYFNVVKKEGNYYYVSVNKSDTTEVIAWYKVDLEKREVSEY